ncbi:MAG: Uncharacterised protein [Formosa sp. Hel1_33_131]|nr:MAG: Uncharacterised protein [Formosa sp. Hel1_33_131]
MEPFVETTEGTEVAVISTVVNVQASIETVSSNEQTPVAPLTNTS